MLKNSHFTSPRSLSECTWHHAYDPIESPPPRHGNKLKWAGWAVFVVFCLLILAVRKV